MFDNIPKIQRENIFYSVLIFGCLIIIANIIYLTFLNHPFFISSFIVTSVLASPFVWFIYKLIKRIKKNNDNKGC